MGMHRLRLRGAKPGLSQKKWIGAGRPPLRSALWMVVGGLLGIKEGAHSTPRQKARALAVICVATAALTGLAISVAPAGAATTTLSSPTALSGGQTLSSTGLTASGAGVTASTDLTTTLSWSQPAAVVSTAFDPNLVRQGRSPDPSDAYASTGAGAMTITWAMQNTQVSWDGIGPLNLGSPSFSATGPCTLEAGGSDYVCHLTSSQQSILDTYPVPGPYVKLGVAADVTVTPQGIATLRQATLGGSPDGGPVALTLGSSPITDALALPCSVTAGEDLKYALGSLATTPGISVADSLVFDVGLESPLPIPPFSEVDVSFATPSIPIGTQTGSITMTGAGASFDLGSVLANDIPPVADPGGPYTGIVGSPISFDGSGSSTICGGVPSLVWDFGDGGLGSGPTPQHTYATGGTFTGSLTATDVTGLSSTTSFTVTVEYADVSVVKSVSDPTPLFGAQDTYTVVATNAGDIASAVTVTDDLPAGVHYLSSSASGTGACTPTETSGGSNGTGVVTCTITSLGTGAPNAVTLTIDVSIDAAAVGPNSATWTQAVPSSTGITSGSSNAASVTPRFTVPCISHSGNFPLNIRSGQAYCVAPGASIGSVRLSPGGALLANGAWIFGSISSTGAAALDLCGSSVLGPVTITASTGYVQIGGINCPGNGIRGTVIITKGTGGLSFTNNGVFSTDFDSLIIVDNTGGFTYSGNTVSLGESYVRNNS